MEQQIENGFFVLKETVSKFLTQSAYRIVNLSELFSGISRQKKVIHNVEIIKQVVDEDEVIDEPEDDDEI